MSDSEKTNETEPGLLALNRTAIEYLQGKYGQNVQLTSTTAALKSVIDSIERNSLLQTIADDDAGYCRQSFDRTMPGYSRLYDKCSEQILHDLPEEIIGQ